MLNLFDRKFEAGTSELGATAPLEPGACKPGRLSHTTAAQLLFLVESPHVLGSRPETLAWDRMSEGG